MKLSTQDWLITLQFDKYIIKQASDGDWNIINKGLGIDRELFGTKEKQTNIVIGYLLALYDINTISLGEKELAIETINSKL